MIQLGDIALVITTQEGLHVVIKQIAVNDDHVNTRKYSRKDTVSDRFVLEMISYVSLLT